MENNFTITSEELDVTLKLESVAKNLGVLLLPSPLWATHIGPNFEYIAILHVEIINYCKITVDRGLLITYDQNYQCLNTSVFIQNEAASLPMFQYTVRTLSDITHMLYSLHQLVLCKNSDRKDPNCLRYLKVDVFEKLCANCRVNDEYFYGIENTTSDVNCEPGNESITTTYVEEPSISRSSTENQTSEHVELKCNTCDKQFKTEKCYKSHMETHAEEKYVCSVCQVVSTHRSSHYKHVATHSNDNTILCNICGKTFCKGYGLENHLLTHSQEKPYECNICFKTYSSKKNLRIHSEMHKGNRPYSCTICNKTFTTPSNLSTHVKSLHNKKKPHACVMCGMSFLYPQLLKIHMRKHTGEKPYQCTVCGKTFALNVHLTIHMRTHTGERPFICSICGKGFTTTGNLSSHKKVHSKENG